MRAYWYAKFIRLWLVYDKLPWELGYPAWVEFDGIFPLIIREYNKRLARERDIQKDLENMKQQNSRSRLGS